MSEHLLGSTAIPEPTDEQLHILEVIRKHPFALAKDLAVLLKMSPDQMGRRLDDLRGNFWLETRHVVDLVAMGYRLRYRIDVKTNPLVLQQSLERLKGSKPMVKDNPQKILAGYIKNKLVAEESFQGRVVIEDITIVMGDPADLCVTVRVRDHDDILDFVTTGLRATPGIENTSTCLEAWSVLAGKLSEAKEKKRPLRSPRG